MSIIVIGKNGQLARELADLDVTEKRIFLGRTDIDILDNKKLIDCLDNYQTSAIINASAYTNVDKAESDKNAAYDLNHLGVSNLASYASLRDIHLVHVSTDYVFAGDKGSPYKVDDEYAPVGVYGASKVAGEQAVLNIAKNNSCIIRTSWVYSKFGANFVKTMLRLMEEKPFLGIIDDQIGSPTSAKSLAQACYYASINSIKGIHHFTDAGVASWYDFAVVIQEIALAKNLLSKKITINPIPSSAYPTPAKRPSYSVLDKSSLKDAFGGLQPNNWRHELAEVIEQLSHQP